MANPTNLDRVLNALRRRAHAPEWKAEVRGDDLVAETGLTRMQVYDTLSQLADKNRKPGPWIKKEQSGARYRPIVVRLLEPARVSRPSLEQAGLAIVQHLAADPDEWLCPHCGQPINLRELRAEKERVLTEALDRVKKAGEGKGSR